jgi:purine nucleosidase
MRRFIVDTDTASDDAVALIMALREPGIRVEAITVVAGNLPLDLAVKNALVSVEVAHTYRPPVYKGMAKPLLRELFTSEFVHGSDGMGEMDLPAPAIVAEREHAVDAILRLVAANPGELELITLGPLTNIAMACLKAPETMKLLKRITIMGGAGFGPGNITPVAEFNIYVDAEAASIVLNSGIPLLIAGWDVSLGKSFINEEDMAYLLATGSEIAIFCVRCNRSLQAFNLERFGKREFDLPDPAAVAAAIYPDVIADACECYAYVDYAAGPSYGQLVIDQMRLLGKEPNAVVLKALDPEKFKEHLFRAII